MFSVEKGKFVGGGKRWGQSKVKHLPENSMVQGWEMIGGTWNGLGSAPPVSMMENGRAVPLLHFAVRTVEKKVHYLPFLYVGMYKAYNNQRVKAKRCEAKSVFMRNLKCHGKVS